MCAFRLGAAFAFAVDGVQMCVHYVDVFLLPMIMKIFHFFFSLGFDYVSSPITSWNPNDEVALAALLVANCDRFRNIKMLFW